MGCINFQVMDFAGSGIWL